jgi:hypothetical protein
MRKAIAIIAAAGFVLAVWLYVPGLAASMTDTSKTEGAGNTAITRCDANGVTTVYNYSAVVPNPIVSVSVSGIASACAGRTLAITVNNNNGSTVNASGAVPAGGGSMTLTLSSSIAEKDDTTTDISIT